jgi:hypothetical protein
LYVDPVRNPYQPGAGLRPPALVGRDGELDTFAVLLQRAEIGLVDPSMILTGLRGVGKTVLLNELAATAERRDWMVARTEARGGEPSAKFRTDLSRQLNQALRGAQRRRVGELLKAALGTFKSFSLTADSTGALSVGIDIEPTHGRADTGQLEVDLIELSHDLALAAQEQKVGVAVFIDEMQDLDRETLAALCTACHFAGQRSLPFYVVGAGLPNLPAILATAKSYAERLFDYRRLDPLPDKAATSALTVPAATVGEPWDADAAALVVRAAGGYPYFLQAFGKASWEEAPGPGISIIDAQLGIARGTASLDDGFFRSRWDRATRAERRYLAAMSADGGAPSRTPDVAARMERNLSSTGPVRAGLIGKGLIYAPEHGEVAYTVPGMAEFIARQKDTDLLT